MNCLWSIPLIGAIFGALFVLGGYWYIFSSFGAKLRSKIIKRAIEMLFKELDVEKMLQETLAKADFKAEVIPLLDKHLDKMIHALQVQIPMAAMFLSPPLIEKLKGIAKTEIIKMLPELQQTLGEKLLHKLDLRNLLASKFSALNFNKIAISLRPLVWKLAGAAAFWGFLVGVLQLLVVRFCWS